MYFPEEIWQIIKQYYIHDIKFHGKHLKSDIMCILNNEVVDELKELYNKTTHFDRRVPKITYSSKLKKYNYIKLKYAVPFPSYYRKNTNKCYLITEYLFNFTNNHSIVQHYYKYN